MTNKTFDDYRHERIACSKLIHQVITEGFPEVEKIANDLVHHGNVMWCVTQDGKAQHIPREKYDIWYKGEDGGGC